MSNMSDVKLVSLPGDGIGAEVVDATLGVLKSAGERWGVRFLIEPVEAGAARYARTGVVYTEADFELCRSADAILLGALGLPEVVHRDGTEAGADLQFRLRFDLDLYAGVRPIRRYAFAPGPLATPDPFRFTIIRENTEGLYASRGGGAAVGDKVATDTLIITAAGADRIIRFAFDYALANPPLSGPPLVTCVTKRTFFAATHSSGRVSTLWRGTILSGSRRSASTSTPFARKWRYGRLRSTSLLPRTCSATSFPIWQRGSSGA